MVVPIADGAASERQGSSGGRGHPHARGRLSRGQMHGRGRARVIPGHGGVLLRFDQVPPAVHGDCDGAAHGGGCPFRKLPVGVASPHRRRVCLVEQHLLGLRPAAAAVLLGSKQIHDHRYHARGCQA